MTEVQIYAALAPLVLLALGVAAYLYARYWL
jgi:hypothetical protein